MDHFERLGLPRRFSVDADALELAYLAKSRAVHPDFHVAGPDDALAESLELSTAVNEAYSTLRDPFTRAEYLLKLAGGPGASEHRQMPGVFLGEMLEAREQVEQARGNSTEVARLAAEFTKQYEKLLADVAECFEQYASDAADSPALAAMLLTVRGLLNAAKYLRGLLRDLSAD